MNEDGRTHIITFQQGNTVFRIQGEGRSRQRIGSQLIVDGQPVVYGDPRILSIEQNSASSLVQGNIENTVVAGRRVVRMVGVHVAAGVTYSGGDFTHEGRQEPQTQPAARPLASNVAQLSSLFRTVPQPAVVPVAPETIPQPSTTRTYQSGFHSGGLRIGGGGVRQYGQTIQIPETEGPFAHGYSEDSVQINGYCLLRNTISGDVYKVRGNSSSILNGHFIVDGQAISGVTDPRLELTHEFDFLYQSRGPGQ